MLISSAPYSLTLCRGPISYLTVPLYPSLGAWPNKKLGRTLQQQTSTAGSVAPPALLRAVAALQVFPEVLTSLGRPAHVA